VHTGKIAAHSPVSFKMWTKKKQDIVEQEDLSIHKKRFTKLWKPTGFAFFTFFAAVAIFYFGSRFDNYQNTHSLSEAWEIKYFFLGVFLITFIITFVLQILFPKKAFKHKTDFWLCASCDQFYPRNKLSCPKCGKELVDPKFYEWKAESENCFKEN
jgi:hypothetical protein